MNRVSKTLLALLIVMALCATTVQADLIAWFVNTLWKYTIWSNFLGGTLGCFYLGGWGLFWDDDAGALIKECMSIYGGSAVDFEDVDLEFN